MYNACLRLMTDNVIFSFNGLSNIKWIIMYFPLQILNTF